MNPSSVILLAVALLIIADLIITYISYVQTTHDISKIDGKVKDLVYDFAAQREAMRNTLEEQEKLESKIVMLRKQCNAIKKDYNSAKKEGACKE